MTKTVAMFGSARPDPSSDIYKLTREAAKKVVSAGWVVATGGGPGLMQAANEGALEACSEDGICSLGYSIFLPFEAATNAAVQVDHHHKTFFSRLEEFAKCDAFIALPGGWGTLLEILTVVQLLQVEHLSPRPLILVGDMWDSSMARLEEEIANNGFIGGSERNFWTTANSPGEAVDQLLRIES